MRPILRAILTVALALPGSAYAQRLPGVSQADPRPGEPPEVTALRDAVLPPKAVLQAPPSDAPVAGRQKAPRSEKAIGPDLMAYVFAPIGGMVEPITRSLHVVDAALAPINGALLPITGPLEPGPLQPAPEAVPQPAPELVKPAKSGPRK